MMQASNHISHGSVDGRVSEVGVCTAAQGRIALVCCQLGGGKGAVRSVVAQHFRQGG